MSDVTYDVNGYPTWNPGEETMTFTPVGRERIEFPGGERVEFDGGGVRDRDTGKPRFDLLMPFYVPYEDQYLTRVARLMTDGASKYGDRNWEQMSDLDALDRFKASAFRHFMQWLAGETDEDHAAAVFFNVQGAEFVAGRLAGKW